MTEIKAIPEFVKHTLRWKFTDEGEIQEASFFLPRGKEAETEVSDILNIVELSASEYGYEYYLKTECFEIDQGYLDQLDKEDPEDSKEISRYTNEVKFHKTCRFCLWHNGEECMFNK